MIDLPLTEAEREAFEETLAASHQVRVTVRIHDRQEAVIGDLVAAASRVLGGAVQVDTKAEVSRSLGLTVLDPNRELAFDSGNPAEGALYADNFVSVLYGVYVPDVEWVDVPVFWGPLTSFARTGPEVTLEAQGKEALLLAPHFVTRPFTLRKGAKVRDAIRQVAARAGEGRFTLPTVGGKLTKARSVGAEDEAWKVLTGGDTDANGKGIPGLVRRLRGNYRLFYDGEGRLTLRRHNATSLFTFGDDLLTSRAGFRYDVLAFRNRVVVKGGTPKNSQKHFHGFASLPANHPMSPVSLGRGGQPRYMTEFVEVSNLKSDAACRARAQDILAAKADQGIEATFECLPVPHLEELDRVTLRADGFTVSFPLQQFTLPLTGEAMSVGFTKNVKLRKRVR